VDERFKSHAWKACLQAIVTGVRIPPSPPIHCFTQSQKASLTRHLKRFAGFLLLIQHQAFLLQLATIGGITGGMCQFDKFYTPTLPHRYLEDTVVV
jgi:hypothetical protein